MARKHVRIGNRTYRVINGAIAQVATWNHWLQMNNWTDVKTEATRLKVIAAYNDLNNLKEI